MTKSKLLIGKNIYDSKLIDVWFTSVSYMAIASALNILSKGDYPELILIAVISYFFGVINVVHGTRQPYEYLKNIYVCNQSNLFLKYLFDFLLYTLRTVLIITPIIIWLLEYISDKKLL